MTKFKRVDTKNGRTMYFVDGSMKSKEAIPQQVLSMLENGMEIELETSPQDEPQEPSEAPLIIDTKKCLFDGKPATHRKYLHEKDFGLCDEHYQMTTGKIAQAMRELSI